MNEQETSGVSSRIRPLSCPPANQSGPDQQQDRVEFAGKQIAVLRGIVSQWISEGFTTPPYSDEHYDIFEALKLDEDIPHGYDTRRPR